MSKVKPTWWYSKNSPRLSLVFCLFWRVVPTNEHTKFPLFHSKNCCKVSAELWILWEWFVFLEGPKIIVRTEEVLIVLAVLLLWVAAIALFFNRWGKIRMLEPYQPKFQQQHRSSCPLVELEAIPTHKHPSLSRVSMGASLPAQMTYGRMNSISGASSGANLYTVRGESRFISLVVSASKDITNVALSFFNVWDLEHFSTKMLRNIYSVLKEEKHALNQM